MSDGILAAYLLGVDNVRNENNKKIKAEFADVADFADSDEIEKRATVTTWLPDGKDNEAATIEYPDLNHNLRFDVPPTEAIDYFKLKKIVTKKQFDKLLSDSRFAAFTVSGVYQKDLLEAFKSEIQSALQNGTTQNDLVKRFKDILSGASHKELGNFHLETIARTNMQIAYGVGRRREMEDVSDILPFWERSAVLDDRVRPKHRAMHGIILPADHPFWNTHYAPDDFNCRCTVTALLDMPNGYDVNKPNSETTLAMDSDGIPSKAEIGTQVVDLAPGNFRGIPKGADLREVFEKLFERD